MKGTSLETKAAEPNLQARRALRPQRPGHGPEAKGSGGWQGRVCLEGDWDPVIAVLMEEEKEEEGSELLPWASPDGQP